MRLYEATPNTNTDQAALEDIKIKIEGYTDPGEKPIYFLKCYEVDKEDDARTVYFRLKRLQSDLRSLYNPRILKFDFNCTKSTIN